MDWVTPSDLSSHRPSLHLSFGVDECCPKFLPFSNKRIELLKWAWNFGNGRDTLAAASIIKRREHPARCLHKRKTHAKDMDVFPIKINIFINNSMAFHRNGIDCSLSLPNISSRAVKSFHFVIFSWTLANRAVSQYLCLVCLSKVFRKWLAVMSSDCTDDTFGGNLMFT